jgi:small subunit ribosomal protein S9
MPEEIVQLTMPEERKAKLQTPKKAKIVAALGKRKNAIARATARLGTGKILINSRSIAMMSPEIARLKIEEPLVIAGDAAKTVDIDITVSGGGVMGQADAIRQAIALALVGFDKKLKAQFLNYDRTLLVSDVRRNEPHKPSCSKRGPRRHKQRSKR